MTTNVDDMTPDEANAALAEALEGWTILSVQTAIPKQWRGHDALEYHVTLVSPSGKRFTTDYGVGKGIPTLWARRMAETEDGYAKLRGLLGYPFVGRNEIHRLQGYAGGLSVYDMELVERIWKAYTPELVDVMYSLLLDAQCVQHLEGVDDLERFEQFRDEIGGEATADQFRACNRELAYLRTVFGDDEIDRLAQIANQL